MNNRITAILIWVICPNARAQLQEKTPAKVWVNSQLEMSEIRMPLGNAVLQVFPLDHRVRVQFGHTSKVFLTKNSYGPFGTEGVFSSDFAPTFADNPKPNTWHLVNNHQAQTYSLGDWAWWEIYVPWVYQGSGSYPVYIIVLHKPTGAWSFVDFVVHGPDISGHAGLDFRGGLFIGFLTAFRNLDGTYGLRPAQAHFQYTPQTKITHKVILLRQQ